MKQWYALRTKPKKESSAAALLAKAGIEVYLPLAKARRRRDKAPVLEPFFPGYLFGRLDSCLGEVRLANYTPGVTYVVGYGGQPWPVPDVLVLAIQKRLSLDGRAAAQPQFRRGERLIIDDGPLQGIEAIFDRHLSGTGRVRVLVHMLERWCRTELSVWQLHRVIARTAPARSY
ncbi:MAG: transcription termination/antitermination protein NusG [Chloroflexota bacterium]